MMLPIAMKMAPRMAGTTMQTQSMRVATTRVPQSAYCSGPPAAGADGIGPGAPPGTAPGVACGGVPGDAPGAASGGYHLPSDACHQPGPCDVSLIGDLSCQRVMADGSPVPRHRCAK